MLPGAINGSSNGAASHVRFVSLSYDSGDYEQSARNLILAVRPEWTDQESQIEFVRFTDGITNTLLKAVNKRSGWSKDQIDSEAILLRAYGSGTAVLIDREREAQNHELLMKQGLAPELIARFNNGMLYRFIKGSVTSPDDFRTPTIYRAIAARLAQWHAVVPCIHDSQSTINGDAEGVPGNTIEEKKNFKTRIDHTAPGKPAPNAWTVMHKWILALPTGTPEEKERQGRLQEELHSLVAKLSQRPGLGTNGLVFAHCDLLSGNVIIMPSESGSDIKGKTSVHFIDYEYATPSPAAFDLSNHFAEWGGFDCDHGVLPTRAQRREFIQEYINNYFDALPEQPTVSRDAEVDKLMAEVDAYRGMPGIYWGIWALIQATISDIDFDYASYAEIRLAEYWAWKAEEDGSRAASGKEMPLREKRWAQEE